MNIIKQAKDWKLLADRLTQPFSPNELSVDYLPSREIIWNKELIDILSEIETLKHEAVAEMTAAGRKMGAGSQFSLDGYGIRDGTLRISLRPTNYFYSVLDNKAHSMHEFQTKRMILGEKFYGNPYALYGRVLAANSVVMLSDGNYVLQLRGPEVMDYRLAFHNVGGHPKKENIDNEGKVRSWHDVMKTQIQRELGIPKSSIDKIELIGLAENIHTHKPDLLYSTYVNLSSSDVIRGEGAEEWEQLGRIFVEESQILDFIAKNQTKGKIYFPKGTSLTTNYVIKKMVDMVGLDSTTSNNFCPVGEATLALHLQLKGYDLSQIYEQ